MDFRVAPDIATHRRMGVRAALFWSITPLAIFALAIVGVQLKVPGLELAIWWPAAGASMWFVLRVHTWSERWIALALIFVATFAANLTGARGVLICVVYGLVNALEPLIVSALLTRGGRFELRRLVDGMRFVGVALVGAILLGILVGIANVVLNDGDYLAPSALATASHLSAVLLIAPFAVLPPRIIERVGTGEFGAQSFLLAVALIAGFWPTQHLPLGYLSFAALAWGALRFPVALAFTQSLIVAVVVAGVTVNGAGSFADPSRSPVDTAIITVTYLCTIGAFMLLIVTARYENRVATFAIVRLAREREAAERERATALAQQLELERQREDFVATTSHELRTPVTIIAGYADLLAEEELPQPHGGWVEAIRRHSQRLGVLLNDLVTASNIEGPSAPARLPLRRLVRDVIAAHNPMALARGVELRGDVPDICVLADGADARRALGNLVGNAVTFVGEGGTVEISATKVDERVIVSVVDDGPGMSAVTLSHAFEKFYRGPEAEALSSPGTGLGLSIARQLANRNGGDVTLTSERGRGVRASLVLPAAAASS